MIIIGVDFHPEFQQTASVDTETGEFQEKRLAHPEEAEKFYRALAVARTAAAGSVPVSSVGRPTPARSVGVVGSTEPNDRGVKPGRRARGRAVSLSTATDDASRGGCVDRFKLA